MVLRAFAAVHPLNYGGAVWLVVIDKAVKCRRLHAIGPRATSTVLPTVEDIVGYNRGSKGKRICLFARYLADILVAQLFQSLCLCAWYYTLCPVVSAVKSWQKARSCTILKVNNSCTWAARHRKPLHRNRGGGL